MTNEESVVLQALKRGDTFYKVTIDDIKKFQYLMLYPFENPDNVKIDAYHIVLDKNLDEPRRMYYKELANILLNGIRTYEDAKKIQIELIEQNLERLKTRSN